MSAEDRMKERAKRIEKFERFLRTCPNCGFESGGGHYVSPSFGESGFYTCQKKEQNGAAKQ